MLLLDVFAIPQKTTATNFFVRGILQPMLTRLKDFLIGPPLPTRQLFETRLNKIRALGLEE